MQSQKVPWFNKGQEPLVFLYFLQLESANELELRNRSMFIVTDPSKCLVTVECHDSTRLAISSSYIPIPHYNKGKLTRSVST